MRRGGVAATLAASPTMVGAVTVMIVDPRRLPRLQREQRACRSCPPTGSRPRSRTPNALVPGNEVRIGGVRVGLIEDDRAASRHEDGDAQRGPRPEARRRRRAAARRLDGDRPRPLGARAQVPGDRPGDLGRGLSRRASVLPLERRRRPEPVEIDEVLSTFDEPTRVAIQENLVEFGNALAGRGPDLNAALGELPRRARGARAGDEEPLRAARPSSSASSSRIAAAAAEVAPVAETQAQLFVNLDTTFTALAEVARPFIQETISETPPTFAVADRDAADDPALPRPQRDAVHRAAPGRRGARGDARRRSPTRSRSARRCCATRRRSTASCAPTAAGAARASTTTPASAPGLARLQQTIDIFGPAIRFIAPAQTVCNYGTPAVPQPRQRDSARAADGGRWQRFTVFEPPDGPNNEGSPRRGAGQRRRRHRATSSTSTRTRTRPRPGQTARVRGGQRALLGRPAGDRQRARQPGHITADQLPSQTSAGDAMRRAVAKRDRTRRASAARSAGADERIWGRNYRGPRAVDLRPAGRRSCWRPASTSRSPRSCPGRATGYELKATFENAATLRETAPVRIAGVNVGEVTAVERDGRRRRGDLHASTRTASRSTTTPRSRSGRGCSSRATSSSTCSPGSPSAAELDDGGEIPITQTATAVQLDEVLTALQEPQRRGLQRLLDGLRHGAHLRADGGRRRRPGPRRRRARRAPSRSTTPSATAAPAGPRHGDRHRGAARRAPARPLGPDRGRRRHLRQARRARAASFPT